MCFQMEDRDTQFASEGIEDGADAGRRCGSADVGEVEHGRAAERGQQRRDGSGVTVKEGTDFTPQPGLQDEQI